jgi:hypothetical protein
VPLIPFLSLGFEVAARSVAHLLLHHSVEGGLRVSEEEVEEAAWARRAIVAVGEIADGVLVGFVPRFGGVADRENDFRMGVGVDEFAPEEAAGDVGGDLGTVSMSKVVWPSYVILDVRVTSP